MERDRAHLARGDRGCSIVSVHTAGIRHSRRARTSDPKASDRRTPGARPRRRPTESRRGAAPPLEVVMSRAPSLRTLLPGVLVLLSSALVPTVARAVVTQITSSVSANTTWGLPGSGSTVEADVFWVRGSLSVTAGNTLTLRQGIVVKFDASATFAVNGSLQSQGASGANVILTSIKDDNAGGDTNGDGNATLPNAADWGTVYFSTLAPDSSRLTHTQVRFAGNGARGALTFTSTSARLTNCLIQRSYFGIDCAGTAAPVLVGTSIQTSTLTPIVLDFTAAPVFSDLVFSNADNGYDAFGLRGATLSTTAGLPQRGATVGVSPLTNVTYVLLGNLTISASGWLTISPGVVVKPLPNVSITVNGALTMNGTAADTITVTSVKDDNFGQPRDTNNNGSINAPAPGDWDRIVFNQGSSGSIQYGRLKFGSASASLGMVDMTNVNLPVSNTLLSDAAHGIAIRGTSAPVLNTVEIDNSTSTPIYQSVSANPTYIDIGFLGNELTALGLVNETIGVDSHLTQRTIAGYTNITYLVVNGMITMNNPATLTVDPGVVIKSASGYCGFVIHGALVADGTPSSPIVFTSWKDDLYGNPADTNGDGSTTTPNTSDWGYIQFTDTSNDGTSRLDNCRVTYGSYHPSIVMGVVWCLNAAPSITYCSIAKSNWGIRCDGNSAPTISNDDIRYCTNGPILMSVQSDPVITGNTLLINGINGLGLISETLSQNAVLEYRPAVVFPPPNQTTVFAYVPIGTITVPTGVTLTLQPKVVIKPSGGFLLFDVSGVLNAVGGTGSDRVVFTSLKDDTWGGDTNSDGSVMSPSAGDWRNLAFQDQSVDAQCVIRNVLFQFGGGSNQGVVTTVSASPKLAQLEFFQNNSALNFQGASQPECDSLTILNCTWLPIVQSLVSDPRFAHMTLANNAFTAVGLLGETVAQDVRTYPRVLGTGLLDNPAYVPTGTITIAFGAKWTIAPGVVIKMGRPSIENFGASIVIDGALVANGKPDSLIVFTSIVDDAFGGDTRNDGAATSPAANNWASVQFTGTSSSATTVVNHCRFRYGGYNQWSALRIINANTSVTNTTLTSCVNGITIEGNAAPMLINVNVDSCVVPVRMSLVSLPTFHNVNFLGNDHTVLGVINETLAQDVLWRIRAVSGRQNMPYLVDGTLAVGLGSKLTLQPGLIVKLKAGTIDVNRAFVAEGRSLPESLIVFTSYRDDFYGGHTFSAATPNVPAANDWASVLIDDTAIDAQCHFQDCVVRYGGTNGAIRCVNSSPRVDSCLIAYNAVGVQAEGASAPVIRGSSVFGNTTYGVRNTGTSFCVDARYNYWGAASGPNDASPAADLCGASSNAGTGDAVSQSVDYQGFSTTGLQNPLLGDVSLNGQVRAYDASLVLQSLVPLISLTPLQQLVANVDYNGAIEALDAVYILQYVAGLIPALPANATRAQRPIVDESATIAFSVSTGVPRRVGDHWEVPVLLTGSVPIHSCEFTLCGANAGTLDGVIVPAGAFEAHGAPGGDARLVFASATPIAEGEVAAFRFPGGDSWTAPVLCQAKVNSLLIVNTATVPVVAPPVQAFFARPAPNPARGTVRLSIGIPSAEQGARVRVQVLDLAGRVVRTVQNGPLAPGVHDLSWDLSDAAGARSAPGVYLVSAQAGSFHAVRRVVVIR